MSHDTDKLIRQLSLVAFLMAERRPLTARDVKSNVEGYSEMSDEAFARRFYSDRAELINLGVPLHSQRDEFTGEELYTLRSEQYFLPELQLDDDELAALQTALFLLEGQFAYSEPLRLALQNLALGRPGVLEAATPGAARSVEVHDPDYSAEMSGRLTKLENAISKQRTIKFRYWTVSRNSENERTVNPYALLPEGGAWYLVGRDLDKDRVLTFRVSRFRGDIRFATRRERDFRAPEDFDPAQYRHWEPWQLGTIKGEAEIEVDEDTAWWIERMIQRGRVEDGVFHTEYAGLDQLVAWILKQDGRARPLAPPELVEAVEEAILKVAEAHEGPPPKPGKEKPRETEPALERQPGPVAPERFAVLQALLAYLLAACGDEPRAVIPAKEIQKRFQLDDDQLAEHLALLNLVNFGGGCYAVYAQLTDDEVRVEKELFGNTFRRPPRLTPLEARAIRLALEFVGPTIAAEAHTPLDRVRQKLEETFGQFDTPDGVEPEALSEHEQNMRALATAVDEHRVVQIEYVNAEGERSLKKIAPHLLERRLPFWYAHSRDTEDAEARLKSYRLDRMREVTLLDETFEPDPRLRREGLQGTARVLFAKDEAPRRIERGASELTGGKALEQLAYGEPDWLVGEILSFRGKAIVLEPEELRTLVGSRARDLARRLSRAGARR